MSLAIKYERLEDARMRLRNTVVLYKGEPVYIHDLGAGAKGDGDIVRVLMYPLPYISAGSLGDKETGKSKYISSKYFDIAPFPMGYVNDEKTGAFYTSRIPGRMQKQGLSAESLSALTNDGRSLSFASFIRSSGVPEMVMNHYPRFPEALRALSKSPAVAFSRDFSVEGDTVIPNLVFIYHKAKKVGYVSDGLVYLGPKFTCLREVLIEEGIKLGAC